MAKEQGTVNITASADGVTSTILPSNATDKNVTWTSSDSKVVAIDNNGGITAKSVGRAVITATTENGNYTAYCEVFVSSAMLNIKTNV